MLTRELGAHAGEGTTARGVQAIRDELTKQHVDLTGASFIDGSGLSHDDRLTCATLLSVLGVDARPRFAPVADGLAIAGTRGTLALSLRGTHLENNLRAKTGTLTGVSGSPGTCAATDRSRSPCCSVGASPRTRATRSGRRWRPTSRRTRR